MQMGDVEREASSTWEPRETLHPRRPTRVFGRRERVVRQKAF